MKYIKIVYYIVMIFINFILFTISLVVTGIVSLLTFLKWYDPTAISFFFNIACEYEKKIKLLIKTK